MNELTKDEINRIIHEEIMGKCWGIGRDFAAGACDGCGRTVFDHTSADYCSDDSPRSLLNEVVAKVGDATYVEYDNSGLEKALITAIKDWRSEVALCQPANVIARACVEAWRSK